MTAPNSQNRSRDRFAARNASEFESELLVLKENELVAYPCRLADISVGGCAVRATTINPQEVSVAVLRMKDRSGHVDLEIAGRLCWIQQTSVGGNTFGFRFRRNMDPDVIDQMVSQGLVTRRQEERVAYGATIQVRRSHDKPAIGYATLEDFSTAGARLRCDQPLDIGERLLITTTEGSSGSVQVMWNRETESGFECGCVFQSLTAARSINDSLAAVLVKNDGVKRIPASY